MSDIGQAGGIPLDDEAKEEVRLEAAHFVRVLTARAQSCAEDDHHRTVHKPHVEEAIVTMRASKKPPSKFVHYSPNLSGVALGLGFGGFLAELQRVMRPDWSVLWVVLIIIGFALMMVNPPRRR